MLGAAILRPTAGVTAGRLLTGGGSATVLAGFARVDDRGHGQAGGKGECEADDLTCHA